MRTIDKLLNEYGESHQNSTNKMIHWICVPIIFWTVVALLWSIKLPFSIGGITANAAMFALALVIIYYTTLSISISIGMVFFSLACFAVSYFVEEKVLFFPLWAVALIAFVVAWVGQFYGHSVEGKKPSFLKDLQFLLIGPAWLMHFIIKKIGLKY
jgi:uncharacterized membrane protein YGL010W